MNYKFQLTAQNIDIASEKIKDYLSESKTDAKEIIKLRLSVENALLYWQEHLGEDKEVELNCYKRFGNRNIQVQCSGAECNPFSTDDDMGVWARSLRSTLETVPVYDYLNHCNTVFFKVPKKALSRVVIVLGAIAIGILMGLLGMLFPYETRSAICDQVFTPIYGAYFNIFSFCGIPLIFLSVVNGILGVGDIHTFKRIGNKMIGRFMAIAISVTLAAVLVCLPIFKLNYGANSLDFRYGDFINMILDWVPVGLFQPFIESNAMQLIIMAAVFGICILFLNGISGYFVGLLNDVNLLLLQVSSWIAKLIPFFVMVTITKSIWMSEVSLLLSAWKSWVATTGMQLAIVIVQLILVSKKFSVSPSLIVSKISKTFFIALGTNSCVASISENYACCSTKLGIDDKVYSFGIPIGTSIFKPSTAVRLISLVMFMAVAENTEVSAAWMIMLVVMAFILSIAIPAIPGGCLMFCGMLFTQLGISTEVITQMLATDVFFDCICTAFNQIQVELTLASYAGSIGMIDEDVIRRPME